MLTNVKVLQAISEKMAEQAVTKKLESRKQFPDNEANLGPIYALGAPADRA